MSEIKQKTCVMIRDENLGFVGEEENLILEFRLDRTQDRDAGHVAQWAEEMTRRARSLSEDWETMVTIGHLPSAVPISERVGIALRLARRGLVDWVDGPAEGIIHRLPAPEQQDFSESFKRAGARVIISDHGPDESRLRLDPSLLERSVIRLRSMGATIVKISRPVESLGSAAALLGLLASGYVAVTATGSFARLVRLFAAELGSPIVYCRQDGSPEIVEGQMTAESFALRREIIRSMTAGQKAWRKLSHSRLKP